jgi:CubicO group peptidase (beta-lactamase class C family)
MPRPRQAALVATLAAFVASPSLAAQTGARPEAKAAVTAVADSLARAALERGVVGMSIAVARGGDPLVAKGWGDADREAGTAAEAGTVYQIGSVTKQFTAAAIMRLVEQGKLSLDDTLQRHLPDFPTKGHTVTVRHLLNHTSGIPSYTSFLSLTKPWTRGQIVDSIAARPFDFAPGAQWRYNNSAYYLLGLVLEKVTGRPYATLVREWFAAPLGLAHTAVCGEAPVTAIPHGYGPAMAGTTAAPVPVVSMEVPYAAGAICSTVGDLVRWARALAAGQVVRPESFRRMTEPTVLADGSPVPYGFGIALDTVGTHASVEHGGGIPGFVSYLAHYPEEDLTIALIANSPAQLGGMEDRLAQAVFGVAPDSAPAAPLSAAEMSRYAGTYDLGMMQLRVFEQDGRLMSQATGQGAFPLVHRGRGVFTADIAPSPAIRLVFPQGGERARSVTLYQGPVVIPAPRVAE